MGPPVYNPGLPYMTPIPGGCSPGKILHITGTFTPSANSFILKLQSGPSGDPTDEIGFCIYGRVAEGIIGRNAFTRAAGWGQEEATNSAAFARGQNFDVTILCDPVAFKVAINNDHFCEFHHRINPASLTYLNMASTPQDLHLACVWVEDGSAPQPQPPAYAQAPPMGMSYPPQGQYQPPPYSGGPGYAQQYPGAPPPSYHGAPPPQHYGQQMPTSHGSSGGKGLMGAVAGAGAAVAGALGASHLIGKSKSSGGHGYGGYPSHGGYPGHGKYPSHGGGGGGLLNKAMGMAPALAGAAMLTHPKKAMKANMAMKYGVPLAGVGALGAGGYLMHKKIGKGFHCGGSSSGSGSGSSEEEE
ncbi:hypothetical protein Pmani_026072 [Petrolisthes manimaculis]|uniref:Galectin n=1 Tax=Petrolisthes manimaculis TaxID=1843537 RepID=A0AAE1U0H3_9EUCA|nr:hypothetical protein Pmani_026072 [Petrolisthes manimaculis]